MARDDDSTLLHIVAFGFAIAMCIAAVGWALAKIIPAIGVAIGLVVATATTGLATAGVVSAWVVPVAASGLGLAGISVTYVVLVRVVNTLEKKPRAWVITALALVCGFLVELCKEFYTDVPLLRIIFALVAAVWVAVGGYLMTHAKLYMKVIGFLVQLFLPGYVLLRILAGSQRNTLFEALADVSFSTWFAMVGMIVIAVLLSILGTKLGNTNE